MLNLLKKQIDSRIDDMSGIKLRECNWSVTTAGPSPFNNERTELFLLGCKKAMSGNPCKDCFNKSAWDDSKALWTHDPVKMAEHINNNAPNKFITIGGGEPTDQIENLIILCKELKKYHFNIMMYTWKDLKAIISIPTDVFKDNIIELLEYVDIIVDGEFKIEEKLWDGSKEDGLLSSIGSGNQIVWDIQKNIGYKMSDIFSLSIDKDNQLFYGLKDNATLINLNRY